MFRSVPSRLFARTVQCLAQQIPEGFSFVDSKVVDKDIHAPFEALDTLRFTLTRQDEFLFKEEVVKGVTLGSTSGDLGVLGGHEYKIVKLRPSQLTVELTDGTQKKFFCSGGFAHINNEGSCDVNAVECIPLDDFDLSLAEAELTNANAAMGTADAKQKAILEIRIAVLEALTSALKGAAH